MLRSALECEEGAMRAALAALANGNAAALSSSVESRLAPLLDTARGRFLFLEGGGVGLLLARLRKAMAVSASIRPTGVLPWCRLLGLCCRDEESAVALGLLGGHPWVKRLMEVEAALGDPDDTPEEEEEKEKEKKKEAEAAETVAECAAEIASRCSLVRGGFPMRTLALCETSTREALQLPVRMAFDTPAAAAGAAAAAAGDDKNDGQGLVALLTPIADRRMGGQADTGYVNWPAATILARWLALHPEEVAGKSMMEVGAGLGLCGLVAGRWAREVYLTDYNLACLERLRRHVELNRGGGEEAASEEGEEEGGRTAAAAALARRGGVKVRWLDWERIETLPADGGGDGGALGAMRWRVVAADGDGNEEAEEDDARDGSAAAPFDSSSSSSSSSSSNADIAFGKPAWGTGLLDRILGSDVICDASCARGVAGLLAATLKPEAEGGVAYVTAPFPAHRYGVDAFPGELKAHGLAFLQEEVTDPRLLAGIPEASYMRFHLYTIRRPLQCGGGDALVTE